MQLPINEQIKYTPIILWGEQMGQYSRRILGTVYRAQDTEAPVGSLYQDQRGHWVTIADIGSQEDINLFRHQVAKRRERLRHEQFKLAHIA